MALVTTCTTCGLVNGSEPGVCVQCGAELSPLRFERSHLRAGMRVDVGRIPPESRWYRIPGRPVEAPDRAVFIIRRRWASKPLDLPPPVSFSQVSDAAATDADQASWAVSPRLLAGTAGLFAIVAYPALFVLEIVVSIARLLDYAGRMAFDTVGHFAFRRPWLIEVYEVPRADTPRVAKTLRVRGYQRSQETIDDLALALQVGDADYTPSAAFDVSVSTVQQNPAVH